MRPSRSALRDAVGPATIATALAVAIAITLAALAAAASPTGTVADVVAPAVCAVAYAVAGMIALFRRQRNPTGLLMIATALAFAVAAPDVSQLPPLQLFGILTQTLPLATILHLLLAFPSGTLRDPMSRALTIAGYVIAVGFQLPRVLTGELIAPVLMGEPAHTGQLFATVQTVLGIALFASGAVLLVRRYQKARPALRRAIGPIGWYGPTVLILTVLAPQVAAATGLSRDYPAAVGLFQMAVLGLLPIVFLASLLGGAYGRAGDVREALAGIEESSGAAGRLAELLSRALGDPTVRIVDAAEPPDSADSRTRVALGDSGLQFEYDSSVVVDGALVAEVARAATLGLERHLALIQLRARLAELERTSAELREARRRGAEAADEERRRISRDLHDGIQQRIVALGIEAQRIARRPADPEFVRARARELSSGLESLLVDLRRLVHGMLPLALAQHGLVGAVRDLADGAPADVLVHAEGVPQQLPPLAESTAYFVVAEGLANAIKHSGSPLVDVRLSVDGEVLHVEVRDEGSGEVTAASGLRGLTDRVEAADGTVEIRAVPGSGTILHAEVPCAS